MLRTSCGLSLELQTQFASLGIEARAAGDVFEVCAPSQPSSTLGCVGCASVPAVVVIALVHIVAIRFTDSVLPAVAASILGVIALVLLGREMSIESGPKVLRVDFGCRTLTLVSGASGKRVSRPVAFAEVTDVVSDPGHGAPRVVVQLSRAPREFWLVWPLSAVDKVPEVALLLRHAIKEHHATSPASAG